MTLLKKMNNDSLIAHFEKLVTVERKSTSEVIECLTEIDRRKVYLSLGYSSLYSYLTDGLKYSGSAAMRRISAVRLSTSDPELKTSLANGDLNLSQISLISQALRQKKKLGKSLMNDETKSIIAKVKSLSLAETQKIVLQHLEIPPTHTERTHSQADSSIVVSFVLNTEQQEIIERAKELLSHAHPHMTWAELFAVLAKDLVNRKDPRLSQKKIESTAGAVVKNKAVMNSSRSADSSQTYIKIEKEKMAEELPWIQPSSRKSIPIAIKRQVHQRFHCCQFVDHRTQKRCGSTFQLQIDHKKPLWAGGSHSIDNLQILCAQHNRRKYLMEAAIQLK